MKRKGPWSAERIAAFLANTRVPIRIACNGGSGHPVLVSLWFVPIDGRLWCATQESASVVSHLRRDGRCAFEVAEDSIPYQGVRGQALASLDDARGESILRLLIERYLGDSNARLASWLLERAAEETAIVVEPRTIMSWDYSDRMERPA
jgi:hypothetical protein